MLLIDANRVVSIDRLIGNLWGDDPPARAMGTLQAYISNLRRTLEPGRVARQPSGVIVTRPPGYVVVIDPADLDANGLDDTRGERSSFEPEFHRVRGEFLLATGAPAQAAAAAFRRALAVATDYGTAPFAQGAVEALSRHGLGNMLPA